VTETMGKIGDNEIVIETKYPEIVEACKSQGIPVKECFARIKDVDGDGILDLSYPLVSLQNGSLPVTPDNDLIFDPGRVTIAKAYAVKNHESEDVIEKIDDAREDIQEQMDEMLKGESEEDDSEDESEDSDSPVEDAIAAV